MPAKPTAPKQLRCSLHLQDPSSCGDPTIPPPETLKNEGYEAWHMVWGGRQGWGQGAPAPIRCEDNHKSQEQSLSAPSPTVHSPVPQISVAPQPASPCVAGKSTKHHDLSPEGQPPGSRHTQQPLTIHEPQLQSSRSSSGQVSSSLSGSGPTGKQYQGFPRPGMPPYSNLPPRSWMSAVIKDQGQS